MTHDHSHDHDHGHDTQTYYLEQLFTIGVCGALAAVTCLWWLSGGMFFIAEKYRLLILFGGLLLLALAAIRAVALWTSVAEPRAEPVHGHDLPDLPDDPNGHGRHQHDHADGH